jgi:prepilin-type processing-associated H-X9-DG protein
MGPLADGRAAIHEMWFWAVHHADGTCTSFADGHVEHWRWVSPNTVTVGRYWTRRLILGPDDVPIPCDWDSSRDNPDAVRLFSGIWGKWPLGPHADGVVAQ